MKMAMENRLTCALTIAIIIFTGFLFLPSPVIGEEVFVTWDGLEVDKLSSMWLIKRHISPGATIKLLPKGTPVDEGTPFDIPDAGISRKFNQSSFDSLMGQYNLQDPKLQQIAFLIRDIELNTWETKRYKKSAEIELYFFDLIQSHLDRDVLIERSYSYFDVLYGMDSGILEENAP